MKRPIIVRKNSTKMSPPLQHIPSKSIMLEMVMLTDKEILLKNSMKRITNGRKRLFIMKGVMFNEYARA